MMSVESRTLNNGNKIPGLGMGTNRCNNLERIVLEAIEIGYRFIDTAFCYENESEIGKALKVAFSANKVKREDLFISSKLDMVHHRPMDVLPTIKKSLNDLQLHYLDLYLIHFPVAQKHDEERTSDVLVEDTSVSLEDTWLAMEELVKQGYTRSIGVSNFNSQQIEKILKIATIKPVVNEVECHPYLSQEKLRDFCKQKGIVVVGFSPLNAPGRDRDSDCQGLDVFKEPLIQELAEKYNKNAAQIVLKYLVQCEVIPIPQTDNKEHLKSNFDIRDFTIVSEDFERMRHLNRNARRMKLERCQNFREYPFNIEF